MNQYRLKKPKIRRGLFYTRNASMIWDRWREMFGQLRSSLGSQAVHRERRKNPPFVLTVRELRDKL